MAQYIVEIPQAYRARVGGNARITVEATSPMGAKIAAGQYGIPGGALQLPLQVQGNVSSGSLPPTPGGTLDRANNPVYLSSQGANNPLPPTAGGSSAAGLNYRATQPYYGGEQSSGNNFAPNINPAPSVQQQQQATPFQIGGG